MKWLLVFGKNLERHQWFFLISKTNFPFNDSVADFVFGEYADSVIEEFGVEQVANEDDS